MGVFNLGMATDLEGERELKSDLERDGLPQAIPVQETQWKEPS